MKFRSFAVAAAAVSLATAPVAAQISADRAAPVAAANEVGGGPNGVILALFAAAAIIGGIVIAADGDEDPVSA